MRIEREVMIRRSFLKDAAGLYAAGFSSLIGPLTSLASAAQNQAGGGGEKKGSAVGKVISAADEVKEFRDPDTGARVMRLTGDGSDNVHLYFTSEAFIGGSDRTVFGSNRSGKFQYYLLEISERKLVQLTDGESLSPHMGCLAPNGLLMYFDGPVLHALKVDTREDRELYRVPKGWQPHLPTCTADGQYVAFAYGEDTAVSTATSRIYSAMAEEMYQRPGSVIMRVNTDTGEPLAAWGERMWISHVLIHPHQPNLILFCHEGGSLSLQRMWTVDTSTVRGREAKPLYVQKPNEYCVHEYFTRGGEVGYQYEVDREGHREYYNAFIRPDGTFIRQFLLPGRRPGHIQSNTDNTLVVGDAGYLSPEDREGENYISLMTHPEGKARVRRLCRRVPGETQHSHGHPVFSLDDRWVLFNSRIGKKDNVFMADVQSLKG